jgi:hypothetical protein
MIGHHNCWAVVLLTVMLLAKSSRGRHPKSLAALSNLYSSSDNDDDSDGESFWLMASDSAATTSRPAESSTDNVAKNQQQPEQRWIKPSPKGSIEFYIIDIIQKRKIHFFIYCFYIVNIISS